MSAVWISVIVVGLATMAIKAAGPLLLARRTPPPRAQAALEHLAPALLAALVVTQALGGDRGSSCLARPRRDGGGAPTADAQWVGRQRRSATAVRGGRIERVISRPVEVQQLRDLALLRRVRDRIDREYAQPLDVEALARGVHMSAGHLSRQFRRAYGESPYSYLMTRRVERAMALLRRGDLSVTEVCFAVGCSSLGTFSTRFTELVGVPPSVYRRQAADATAGIPSCVAKQVTRPIRS